MVTPPIILKEPEHHLGNFITSPQSLEALKFQQQSAAALGKSMNLTIKPAQPISSMQRGIVTESEYTIPIQETQKYTGVTGLIPSKNQQQELTQRKQVQPRRLYRDWDF